MQIGRVATPHGRPMTLALVRGQLETADRRPSKAVNKWKVFNDIGETKYGQLNAAPANEAD